MDSLPTRDQVPNAPRAPRAMAIPARGAQGSRPTGGAITGQDVLRILRKRKWMIVLTALVITLLTFVGTLLWWLYAPMYTAVARLEVIPPKGPQWSAGPQLYSKEIMERLMLSHAQMALSEDVLAKAVATTDVRETKWFQKDRDKAVQRLTEDLNVRPVPGTQFIEVRMTGTAPTDAEKTDLAQIVNAVARQYEETNSQTITQQRRRDIEEWNREKLSLQEEMERVQRRREDILRRADVAALEKRRTSLDYEMQGLADDRREIRMMLIQAIQAHESVQQQKETGTIDTNPSVLAALYNDWTLRTLQQTETSLTAERANVLRKFGPKHRSVQNLESRLEGLREEVNEREKYIIQQELTRLEIQTKTAVNSLNAQLEKVEQDIDQLTDRLSDLQADIDLIEELATRAERLEERIADIDKRLMDLQILARGEQQIVLRSSAIPPRKISLPRWKTMMALGVFLGVAFGLGLAFLLEFIDTSIKSPADISRKMDLPVLGMIPHSDDLEEEIEDLRLAFMTNPNSLFGEAFRQIRTCLLFSGPADQRRSLLITSPLPEDGRTTVALNLAAAIAHGGRKVLVVDANFRQPAIRTFFPQVPEGGLSSALVGQADWHETVYEAQQDLHVLPAGVMPPSPAELLGSESMRGILAEMVEQYDQVLIDGPPCLVVTDSSVLSTLVDGVVLVVRAGANTCGIVQRARDMLVKIGAHVLGVTLNGVLATSGGYLRKSYETFYEYHEQPQLTADGRLDDEKESDLHNA